MSESQEVSANTDTVNTVTIGVVVGLDADNTPRVAYAGCGDVEGIEARSTVDIRKADIGRQVALLFERGESGRPVVIGLLRLPELRKEPAHDASSTPMHLSLVAGEQLVLRCGEASITLTKAGKIVIDGNYVLNRSNGVNKIKGASIQLN